MIYSYLVLIDFETPEMLQNISKPSYPAMATIGHLNFDQAAARAIHQGSVRNTRGLSSWPGTYTSQLWPWSDENDGENIVMPHDKP